MDKFPYAKTLLGLLKQEVLNEAKLFFLTIWVLNIIMEFAKIHIYPPSLHHNSYQNLLEDYSVFVPINIIQDMLKKWRRLRRLTVEVFNDEDFERSQAGRETFEAIEELKNPQHYDSDSTIIMIVYDLNEKSLNDPRVQAMFKRSTLSNISTSIMSQDSFELPKKTVRAIGNYYQMFKPNYFRDVQKLYQNKASIDNTPNQFKPLTSLCWNER